LQAHSADNRARNRLRSNATFAREYYFVFTFFGSQSFFFFDATTPHSLQRQSPGLALRIGFPFWQLTAQTR
jgi:hypothetical protein